MAKQQTFVSKTGKKGASEFISVKVIVSGKSEKGTWKYTERFIKVKDLAEVEAAIKP